MLRSTVTAFLLIFACLALGALVARLAAPPPTLAQSLNWWVINVALPALVLELVPNLEFNPDLWFLPASMWLVFLGAWAVFALVGRRLGWSRGRIGALVLTCGLSNSAFIGYPMIEAMRGTDGLALAVVADQLGVFLALAVGGIIVAAIYSGREVRPASIVRSVLTFPAFVALIVGVVAGALGGWPPSLAEMFSRIGGTLVPLALFSVGLRLRLEIDRSELVALAIGLGWKLALAPIFIYLLGAAVEVRYLVLVVGVLQAGMAPMISSAILAEQHGLDPRVAHMMLGAGIVLSLLTVPFVNYLL